MGEDEFNALAAKKLAAIAARDGCDMREAFARALDMYAAIQLEVWGKQRILGIATQNLRLVGILANDAHQDGLNTDSDADENFDLDI